MLRKIGPDRRVIVNYNAEHVPVGCGPVHPDVQVDLKHKNTADKQFKVGLLLSDDLKRQSAHRTILLCRSFHRQSNLIIQTASGHLPFMTDFRSNGLIRGK